MENKVSLEYQLGHYVGEYIYLKSLPTISTDGELTRKVIYVTAAEGDSFRQLENDWFKICQSDKDDSLQIELWKQLQIFRNSLIQKYLPNPLVCFIPVVTYTEGFDESSFKEGIRTALWNCDCCNYRIEKNEDIEIVNDDEDRWFTKIILKLD